MGNHKGVITELDAVLCFGQSNEEGSSNNGTASAIYLGTQKNTYIFYKPNDITTTNNGRIQAYKFGLNNNYRPTSSYGPDISLGYAYNQSTGKPLLIIKYALGGSGLFVDGVFRAAGNWQVGADPILSNNLVHHDIALNSFVIPCINICKARNIKLNIKAGFWMQGEADANSFTASLVYESLLIQFWDSIISTLTPYGVLSPNFKPVISRIHDKFSPPRPYQNEIRTALVNVANHYNSYWINTDSYNVESDFTHFTIASQEQHGIDRNTILQTYFT